MQGKAWYGTGSAKSGHKQRLDVSGTPPIGMGGHSLLLASDSPSAKPPSDPFLSWEFWKSRYFRAEKQSGVPASQQKPCTHLCESGAPGFNTVASSHCLPKACVNLVSSCKMELGTPASGTMQKAQGGNCVQAKA